MLRSILLLTVGLSLLPSVASAQATECPLHKRLEAQKTVQSAALSPITASALAVQASQISIPRESVATPTVPSYVAPSVIQTSERGVDVPAPMVQVADNNAQTRPLDVVTEETKIETDMTLSPHADWTTILQNYVSAPDAMGLTHFDYAGLKANAADKAQLDGYIKSLEVMDPKSLLENEAIVFWANLYNAVTVQVVTENYPIKSIRKLGSFNSGPWKKDVVTVKGIKMSLDDIEHETLRKTYPSPYIHYMVNCASVGCPNLLDRAWEADTFDTLRKKAAADYINSPRGVIITPKGLKVSSIYKWFKEDFGGKDGVLNHIRDYADADLAAAIDGGAKVVTYDYDWSLNNK